MKMLHKYLCRVVSNAYQIVIESIYLENLIDKLRKSEPSGNTILDTLMNFHLNVLKKFGRIPIDNIFKTFEVVTKNVIPRQVKHEIFDLFYRDDLEKILSVICVQIKKNIKYVLLLELIYNTILYKLDNQMLVFRKYYFMNDYDIRNIDNTIKLIKKNSLTYLKKKPVLNKMDLISQIKIFVENNKNEYIFEKMWMFGSYAKGTNDRYSDLDLMIKFKPESNIKKLTRLKWKLEEELKLPVDLVLVNENLDEFDRGVLKHAIEIY